MKSCFSWWLPVGVLCLPSFVVGQNKPGAENPNVQLTLGKKTTVIVTPVDSRGRPDYMAAINQRHAQGVTAANNAAIALLEAVGPNEIPPPEREDFFKRLGMKSLPATGAYYVSLKKYGQELIEKQQRTAAEIYGTELWSLKRTESVTQQLWNEDEAPLAAQWLRRNQGALDLLERGSRRPRLFVPWFSKDDPPSLVSANLFHLSAVRNGCRALTHRARLRARQGKVDLALRDLLACHRWASLLEQEQASLIGALVAIAVKRMAMETDLQILHQCRVTAKQLDQYRQTVQKLPASPPLVRTIDVGERFTFLDTVCLMAFEGPQALGDTGKISTNRGGVSTLRLRTRSPGQPGAGSPRQAG